MFDALQAAGSDGSDEERATVKKNWIFDDIKEYL